MSFLVNLLPDIRQAKIRAKKRRQLAIGIAVSTWVVCGGVVVLLLVYMTGQKVVIANYTKSIADNKVELEKIPGIGDAYTAEQHLAALPGLYAKRVYLTKFFDIYTQVDPTEVTVGSMNIDVRNQLVVSGSAKTYAAVAKLARALEAANTKVVKNPPTTSSAPYFSNITIANTNTIDAAHGVSFTISATLDSGVLSGSN